MISFIVPGIPVAKGRPRFARVGKGVRTFTPAKTVRFEERVMLAAQAAGVTMLTGPVEVSISAIFGMVGPPRKRKPREAQWKATRPDVENVAKAVLDALNGIAYRDDAQVVSLFVTKRFAAQGEQPGTCVQIQQAEALR